MSHHDGSHPDRQDGTASEGQYDLFAPDEQDDLTAEFLEFHERNPHVYSTLRDLARQWRRSGKGRCGISMFYGTVRWQLSLKIEGDELFELNDHHQAFYSRALMHFEPDLAGLFELRRAAAADAWIGQYRRTAA